MSDHNNIYNIMGRLDALKPQQETSKETAQRIYESVEAKGSVLEGVKSVEATLNEKYMGFKKTVGALKKQDGVENPEALAASIGRKKYGKTAFQKAAAAGKKMGEAEETCNECGMYEAKCTCDHDHMSQKQGVEEGMWDAIKKSFKPDPNWQQRAGQMAGHMVQGAMAGGAHGHGVGHAMADAGVAEDAHGAENFKKIVRAARGDVRGIMQQLQEMGLHSEIIKFCRWARENGIADIKEAMQLAFRSDLAADEDNEIAYEGYLHAKELLGQQGMKEDRETLKTKKGTIYKGGKYGTEYDAGEDSEKKKPKAKDGEKKGRGRPKKEAPAEYTGPKGDIFGRTKGEAPKGKKGTVIKGKGNQDTVDESAIKSGKALMENVNFKKMMDECNMTADEMLECLNGDIQAYKATGDMTNRLRDFMHLHNHIKQVEMESAPKGPEFAPQMPSGQDILPQQSTLGKIGSTVKKAFTGPDDAELLAQLQQDSQHATVDEELNELAKLAGITDEGNAFTGKLASTPKGGDFELDGENFTDTSSLEEGNNTSLEDIARLSGIFQEGKDYGDTSYNEPPTYDNTPDEEVMGVEVQTQGGDGEVAGKEKAMKSDKPTWKNADNPLAEDKEILKPASEFNFVKEMGRDLMQAYQNIKTK